ncbi:MAG: two-component system response regulator, partial [Nitrospinae bacterium]|nr:two-component system response regulator [Nitrospinota bacterium]
MPEPSGESPFAASTVAVVDDSPMMLSLISMALNQLGIVHVRTARTGADGLHLLRETPFDLLIL